MIHSNSIKSNKSAKNKPLLRSFSLKPKRYTSTYKSLYIDRLNYVPGEVPLTERKDSGYSTFYQNSSVNLSREVEENGMPTKNENKSTININVNLGPSDASSFKIKRVKTINYVGPKNKKKGIMRSKTLNLSKIKTKGKRNKTRT